MTSWSRPLAVAALLAATLATAAPVEAAPNCSGFSQGTTGYVYGQCVGVDDDGARRGEVLAPYSYRVDQQTWLCGVLHGNQVSTPAYSRLRIPWWCLRLGRPFITIFGPAAP